MMLLALIWIPLAAVTAVVVGRACARRDEEPCPMGYGALDCQCEIKQWDCR